MAEFSSSNEDDNDALLAAHRMILSAGVKLDVRSETVASASLYFHKFYKQKSHKEFDGMLMAATCLYLAGKVEEEPLRMKDVMNVFHNSLNPKQGPLELVDSYRSLRDSIVQCELLLLRALKFHVNNDLPHRYLSQYVKSLSDWMQGSDQEKTIMERTCWSILSDFYSNKQCIEYGPQEVAIAVISLALQSLQIQVPCNHNSLLTWNEVLCKDVSQDRITIIIRDLLLTFKDHFVNTGT
ncbi:Cyclin-K [Halotydeus destructor]|nr:Cyclin-K [Halotydeus destructor]